MYVYIASYFFLLFCSPLLLVFNWKCSILSTRLLFFIGLLPAILLVGLRGDVGTDTGNYLQMAGNFLNGSDITYEDLDVEIGFFWLLKLLVFLTGEPRFVINFISFLIALYSFVLFSKKAENILIFSLLIFPVFFFDMSMNGLRYGLAFLLAKHASDKLDSNKGLSALALISLSLSFQLSGLLVLFLLQVRRLRFRNIIYLVPLLALLFVAFQDRLASKVSSYEIIESPNDTSGLWPLAVFLACYLGLFLADRAFCKKFFFLFVAEVLAFLLARATYAGLRFQLLILFVFFCYISMIRLQEYKHGKLIIGLFLVVGLFGFVGTLRNFANNFDVPPSPFLPYRFFSEIN